MSYPEVEVQSGDEHIGFQPDLVDAGWWQGDCQGHSSQQRRRTFPIVRERVLRPKSADQQYHLWIRRIRVIVQTVYVYIYIQLTCDVMNEKRLFP